MLLIALAALSLTALLPKTGFAQWGYAPPQGGLRYRGLFFDINIGPAVPPAWASPHPRFGVPQESFGAAPPRHPSDHDRERFYHDLDRMHRYQTREERYESDFRNAYTDRDAVGQGFGWRSLAIVQPQLAVPPSARTDAGVPGQWDTHYRSGFRGQVPDPQVADQLRAAANRLHSGLSRKRDAHVWLKHLAPQRIIDSIDRAEFPGALSDLLINYQGVADNPRLVLVARTEGFEDTRDLLAHYVTLPSRFPQSEDWQHETSDPSAVWPPLEAGAVIVNERVVNQTPGADPQAPALPRETPGDASMPELGPSLLRSESAKPMIDTLPDLPNVTLPELNGPAITPLSVPLPPAVAPRVAAPTTPDRDAEVIELLPAPIPTPD